MSFQAMTWAVEQDLPARDKLVLLLLANYASCEDGSCYPSLDTLARQCGMARSTVKEALASLAEGGLIEIHRRDVGGVCMPNTYRLRMDVVPADHVASRQPAGGAASRPGRPPAGRGVGRQPAPNQSVEPVTEPVNKNQTGEYIPARMRARAEIAPPAWLDTEAWRAFLEHRRKARKPMTEHAQRLAIRRLAELREQGHDPRAVLEQSILHGWQGLFPLRQDRGAAVDTAEAVRRAAEAFARDGGPQ